MELAQFVSMVSGFDAMGEREQIRLFAWYIHTYREAETLATGDVRKCFEQLRLVPPNVSSHLTRMAEAKTPSFIRSKGRYKLHRRDMVELDGRYAAHPTTLVTSKLLAELPAKVPDLAERTFLKEAIDCYGVRAYRAAIVMTWNLTYDHLVHWIFADPKRLSALNAAFAGRFQRKPPIVAVSQDIEGIKEFDVIEACGTAGLVTSNVAKMLKEKLTKRNVAAHPSAMVVLEPQANDVITDLVSNVVLMLK